MKTSTSSFFFKKTYYSFNKMVSVEVNLFRQNGGSPSVEDIRPNNTKMKSPEWQIPPFVIPITHRILII